MKVELKIVKSGGSLRLLLPKGVVEQLGWGEGDVIEFTLKGSLVIVRSIKGINGLPRRRRLRRFAGSYAVTIPAEIKKHFTPGEMEFRVEDGGLVGVLTSPFLLEQ